MNKSRIATTAIAGVIAGVAFGAMMQIGMSPFAPLMMAGMQSVAMGSLMGHLVFGVILGGVFVALLRPVAVANR